MILLTTAAPGLALASAPSAPSTWRAHSSLTLRHVDARHDSEKSDYNGQFSGYSRRQRH